MNKTHPTFSLATITLVAGTFLVTAACKNRDVHRQLKKDGAVTLKGAPDEGKQDPTVVVTDPETDGPTPSTVSNLCRYIDTSKALTEVIPGSPEAVAIPISDYTKRPEFLTKLGSNISFNYTIFQRQDGSQKTLFWDSKSKGWFAVDYKATIQNSDSQACTITAVATSSPTERTLRGCFAPETMITMADGTRKKIDLIKMNDHVMNPLTGNFGIVVRITKGPEASKSMFEIGFKGGRHVVVTSKHPFLTKNGSKTADELTSQDEIAVVGGTFKKVTHLVKRAPSKNQRVVNIAVASSSPNDRDHMVEADGIVAGDLFLQEKLDNINRLKNSVVSSK